MAGDLTTTSEPGKGPELDSETASILSELEGEGFEIGEGLPRPAAKERPAPTPVEVKPEVTTEPKPKEGDDPQGKKPDEAKETDDTKQPNTEKGDWREMIGKRRTDRIKELEEENDRLKSGRGADQPIAPSKPVDTTVTPKGNEKLSEVKKIFDESYGISSEHFEALVAAITPAQVEKIIEKEGISPEDATMLREAREERVQAQIERGFRTDFEENVLPLIKSEYPGISDEGVKKLREEIFGKIQTDEFARTPLKTIFKGEDGFRKRFNSPQGSIDSGRPGSLHKGGKDWSTMSETDINNLSDEEFDQYSDYMAKQGKRK